jgi:hypothetical protein
MQSADGANKADNGDAGQAGRTDTAPPPLVINPSEAADIQHASSRPNRPQ